MKRLILPLLGILLYANTSFAQGIDDRAVIPVSVTLNSILRLNVVSGGNIEFNFNTLSDYQNGISNSSNYNTVFTVASSVDWNVEMYTEDATLVGTDNAGTPNTLALDNIGYHITSVTAAANYDIPAIDPTAPLGLNNTPGTILVGYNGTTSNAGGVETNNFTIHWECGTTPAGGTMAATSILEQQAAADRYATNIFLILSPVTP